MASDILIYKAGLVPVGIDQEPHLEVARNCKKDESNLRNRFSLNRSIRN